jgi:AcrR family transcriptional regulator
MTLSKIDTWIKAGYKLLGTEGMDGIKVERLAKILDLNKSGFYHYFGAMELYIKRMLQYHVGLATTIASEVARCQNIDPDLLLLIVEHKSFFLVEAQLLVKARSSHLDEGVDEAGRIVNDELLLLWRKTCDVPEDSSAALGFLNIIRHFFYARMDPENVNYEFLHGLAVETEGVLHKVIMDKHVSSHNIESSASSNS